MARLSAEELQRFLETSFTQASARVDRVDGGSVTVRQKIDDRHLRPGGTVSGPTLMAMADMASYIAVLAEIGIVPLAVTTNLNITFMRKPSPERDVIATGTLLKLGQRLAVAAVELYSDGVEGMLAHATVTYSIPPRPGN